MANNFDTVKLRAASEKFNLIRLEPARDVTSDLTLDSGTTYSATFFWTNISKLEVNGVAYDLVTGAPASGEFSFDESTQELIVNLGAALTTQVVVAYYYLFFTRGQHRQTYETPTDSNTVIRRWEPRINREPQFSFDIRDIQEGILSFGVSGVELSNEDGHFLQFFGGNDSFSNKAVTIWICLDNTENVRIAFKGVIKSLRVSRKVFIEFFDEFSVLSRTFFSNSTYLASVYNTTSFPNLAPNRENSPIYRLFAETSYYRVIDDGLANGLYKLEWERLLEASCVNFTNNISNTNNREWGTVLSEGNGGLQTDTVQTTDHVTGSPNYSIIGYTNGKKYKIGDTLKINTHRVRVYYVDEGSDELWCTFNASIATTDTITRPGISSIIVRQDNQSYYCLFDRDYTVSYTGNTNDIIQITFVNNFEATVGMASPLNPNTDQVLFRAWCDTAKNLNHGSVVQTILQEAGLTVNSASITAANLTSLKTNFYIPFVGQSFTSYTSVLQKLLFSTFGYISLNNDLEFEYNLFSALSPTDDISDDQILLESFSTQISYNDLRDSITPENDHDIIELGFQNTSLTSPRTKYLHGISTNRTYNHILATTSRMDDLFGVISERRATYFFRTKTNPDQIIGDQITISRDKLIGNDTSKNVILIGLTKKTNEVDFVATDLFGI